MGHNFFFVLTFAFYNTSGFYDSASSISCYPIPAFYPLCCKFIATAAYDTVLFSYFILPTNPCAMSESRWHKNIHSKVW